MSPDGKIDDVVVKYGGGETGRQAKKQAEKQAKKQAEKQTKRQANKPAEIQAGDKKESVQKVSSV
ncbi:MAG: hypothetical protein K6G58_07055 [Lachnospiraceae bacterium]|nr:hypothetical protein [Lachnospiraceae bacterium]